MKVVTHYGGSIGDEKVLIEHEVNKANLNEIATMNNKEKTIRFKIAVKERLHTMNFLL